jgi:hypothetical protein
MKASTSRWTDVPGRKSAQPCPPLRTVIAAASGDFFAAASFFAVRVATPSSLAPTARNGTVNDVAAVILVDLVDLVDQDYAKGPAALDEARDRHTVGRREAHLRDPSRITRRQRRRQRGRGGHQGRDDDDQ